MAVLNAIVNDLRPWATKSEDSFVEPYPLTGEGQHIESLGADSSLCFILKGEVEFSCNDFLYRRFGEGQFFFIPRSSSIFWTVIEELELLILPFDLLNTEIACDNYSISRYININHEDINYDFRPLEITHTLFEFVKLMLNYIRNGLWGDPLCQLKQKELLLILQKSYSDGELAELFYPEFGNDIAFKHKIMELSQENLSTKEMAERLHMSPRNFSRRFNLEFGLSPHQWMLKEKSKHIKLRMAVPGVTVKEIANEFGFTSTSYFHEYCRRQFGRSPQQLMRELRNPAS